MSTDTQLYISICILHININFNYHKSNTNTFLSYLVSYIRFNQLWRQHVYYDKHSSSRWKPTKCETFLRGRDKSFYSEIHNRYITVYCVCSPQFPMGAGGDGPLGGMAGMEPHHMNGSIGGEIKVLIVSKFVKYYKKVWWFGDLCCFCTCAASLRLRWYGQSPQSKNI